VPRFEPEDPFTIDLHGHSVERARRRARQALHEARVRGLDRVRLITGAGHGNPERRAVLRDDLERWLRSEGRALGVRSVERASRGGALDVRLAGGGRSPLDDAHR
jgi:DNA-nicking Smr family endonuclease